jgi:RND superfamily putative drug exporter
MSRLLYRLGGFAVRHRRSVLAAWILFAIAVSVLGARLGGSPSENFSMPGTESQAAFDLLKGRFPAQSGSSVRAVVADQDGNMAGATVALADYARRLAAIDGVVHVTDLSQPEEAARHFSADGRVAYLDVTFTTEPSEMGPEKLEALKAAAAPLETSGLTTGFGGDVANDEEPPASEGIGIFVAIVVLLFAFGSVIAMGLPILTALVGLAVGLGGITVLSAFVSVTATAPMLASMIGLAVGIDYALFVVTRHRQFMAEGHPPATWRS